MQLVTKEKAIEALAKIKQGGTLTAERKKLGLGSSQPLRRALVKLLGGKEKYADLMAGGRSKRSNAGEEEEGPTTGGE